MNIPNSLKGMVAQERWEWFDKQCDVLKESAEKGVAAKLSAETVEAFVFMLKALRLKHVEAITMHNNAVATIGAALVEQHRQHIADHNANFAEDKAKYQVWYAESIKSKKLEQFNG